MLQGIVGQQDGRNMVHRPCELETCVNLTYYNYRPSYYISISFTLTFGSEQQQGNYQNPYSSLSLSSADLGMAHKLFSVAVVIVPLQLSKPIFLLWQVLMSCHVSHLQELHIALKPANIAISLLQARVVLSFPSMIISVFAK